MDFNPDTWGTVADWVGGLGTTAAFIAMAIVINRDAKARRMFQARKVVFLSEATQLKVPTQGRNFQMKYTLQNHSDEPIYRVMFYTQQGYKDQDFVDAKIVLPPGALHTCAHIGYDNDPPICVTFRDSSGLGWIRCRPDNSEFLPSICSPQLVLIAWPLAAGRSGMG